MDVQLGQIIAEMAQYGYIVLFPLALLEGPIVTVVAGFLCGSKVMDPVIACIIILLADLAMDSAYYALGRFGREGAIRKWGRWFGITIERVEAMENLFKDHFFKTMLASNHAHGVGIVALVAAGAANASFPRFLAYDLATSLPKTVVLLMIGYYFGGAISSVAQSLDFIAYATVIFAAIAVLVYWLVSRYRNGRKAS